MGKLSALIIANEGVSSNRSISLLTGDTFFFKDTMSIMHVDDRVKLTSGPMP